MSITAKTVANGDKVVVHYIGSFEDGEQFDNSYNRGVPVEVVVGNGTLIEGFNTALIGMSVGQTRKVTVDKDSGYGDVNPDAIITVPKEGFPEDFPFDKKGAIVPLRNNEGNELFGRLHEVTDSDVLVDLNHPMAGKTLNFEIELVGITKGPEGTEEVTESTTTVETLEEGGEE